MLITWNCASTSRFNVGREKDISSSRRRFRVVGGRAIADLQISWRIMMFHRKKKTMQNHLSCGITLCFLIVTSFFLQILIIFGTIVKSQWFSQTPPPMNVCLKSDHCHQWNDNEFLEGQPLDTMEWQWFSMVPSHRSNDPSFRSSKEGPSFLQWTSAAVR